MSTGGERRGEETGVWRQESGDRGQRAEIRVQEYPMTNDNWQMTILLSPDS
jgi:hypothetical protein